MLELLEDEVIRSLGLLGVTSFAELEKIPPASGDRDQYAERILGLPAARYRTVSLLSGSHPERAACHHCHAALHYISLRHAPFPTSSSPSLTGDADALLFDLGRVVIDIDFTKVLACWAGHAGCALSDIAARFAADEIYFDHERGKVSDEEYFDNLRRLARHRHHR